ncbi:FAD-dependent oxidoreductase [Candidatus Falkowbacteria bacterium RIFOXYA2_FULL_35_8]|uniref:FAD-dependent oxidoreductase n=1 Tax=Candidatus Falkowbacteria bacterium RIFOXYC2_FULL_36_12 TaxID=1798002 RepID=A0A1F5T1I1_9BACT|nr:MAG: FAD-dependent oxidoreductase [Candidatus Falkowbacteria bacterium RIFOXYB2_FULL_35_7]OGF32321.1 MAG: FAD-dependent oxidoreductase [Candidatus Falkowbacteria bacterium RIFOXYC2_FULL_36_12]OGF34538.1 MAG: FAD-dependent oxidoreductase [Candidatus Falkowbacteria bacterium RIFOXYA2_FULL_35_8]
MRNILKSKILVIGGGPAGMMSALQASEKSSGVVLVEKNDRLGLKLLITGKGRCNITNAETEVRSLVQKFGKNGKFLYSSLNKFSVDDVVSFFQQNGLKTKTERGGRIFPVSNNSADVLAVLVNKMKKNNVKIVNNDPVVNVIKNGKMIEKVVLKSGREVVAEKFIICTGGKSYPATGSTGDGYRWLKNLGHNLVKPEPVLVPIMVKENFVKELEGLSLKNVAIKVFQKNKKQDERFGEAIFTNNGMSGPIILDLSKSIGSLLQAGKVELRIDFKPGLSVAELDARIQRDFKGLINKDFKNSLDDLLPQKLIPVVVKLSNIDKNTKVNSITREERKVLVKLLKEFVLEVDRLDGFEKAIVTKGGVDLREIDPQTMKSKIIENLYFAGEILDLDGPTGGYNLQVCWSTGFVAGNSVLD